jgi:hypothetical protein
MYAGRNMEQVEVNPELEDNREHRDLDRNREEVDPGDNPPAVEEEENADEDENIVKRDIKRMFHRTTRDARRMFLKVRRSFVDFINR